MFPSASHHVMTPVESSREMLHNYIRALAKKDIKKILTPVKDGLLTENSILYMNTQYFSVDHLIVPITVRDFLEEVGPEWKKWLHTIKEKQEQDANGHWHHSEDIISNEQMNTYIHGLTKYQRRSLLNLIREGILTDECHINVADHSGPERVQIPMPQVVYTLREGEKQILALRRQRNVFYRLLFTKHFSSACFRNLHKADLDIRPLPSARFTMPVWYTFLFAFMTLGTFASHIWSQATNYSDLSESLTFTVPTILLVISSVMIGVLLYLVIYMVGFLACCEHNFHATGLCTVESDYSSSFRHFSELHYYQRRIYITKAIQFILLWYSMFLSVYAHEKDLNIYPALMCVLTNGFGLMLFARIAIFFRTCRRIEDHKAIVAR